VTTWLRVPVGKLDTPAQPAPDHDRTSFAIETDLLDHHPMFDAEHPRPYPRGLDPVAPRPFQPSDSRKAKPYDVSGQRVLRQDPDGTRTLYLGAIEISHTTAGGLSAVKQYPSLQRTPTG
jgi:hypothetical protein